MAARRTLSLVLLAILTAIWIGAWIPQVAHSAEPTLTATVLRVIDGDTLEVHLDGRTDRVRLIGVDTPETVHPEGGVEPWGPEASSFTKTLLPPGTQVRLQLDVQQRDRYGRLLVHLYLLDGQMSMVPRRADRQILTRTRLVARRPARWTTAPSPAPWHVRGPWQWPRATTPGRPPLDAHRKSRPRGR